MFKKIKPFRAIFHILAASLFISADIAAQDQNVDVDTVVTKPVLIDGSGFAVDTSNIVTFKDPFPEHSPAKASLYSAVLPGLGQAYNKQYWKIPLIYGGVVIIGYFIDFNHQQYIAFRQELFAEIDGDPSTVKTSPLSEEVIRRGTDDWRRNRDLLYFTAGFLYILNIVDAHVFAHLKSFDIDESISLKLEPSVDQLAMVGSGISYYPGVSLRIIFK